MKHTEKNWEIIELTNQADIDAVCGGLKFIGSIDTGIFDLIGGNTNNLVIWRNYFQQHGQWPQALSEFMHMGANGVVQKHPFSLNFFTQLK